MNNAKLKPCDLRTIITPHGIEFRSSSEPDAFVRASEVVHLNDWM